MDDNAVKIVGSGAEGVDRNVILMRGQPGKIVVTAYAGEKPVTVIVSAVELRAAIDSLCPVSDAQQKPSLPNGSR